MVNIDKIKDVYQEKLRVVIYARVSTGSDEQANSLENQIEHYTSMVKNNPNWTLVGQYVDKGISGKSVRNRLEFQRMVNDAEEGMFDLIVTKEISRFSRNILDSIKYTRKLLRNGVGVLFDSDRICTFSPGSEFYLTFMAGMAQEERRKIAERVKFGFQQAIENDVVLGNNHIWGYRKDKGRLVIEEREARIVKRIFELYVQDGMGIRKICDLLNSGQDEQLRDLGPITNKEGNPLTFTTIRGILTNPKYKGFYCGRKTKRYEKDDKNSDDPILAVQCLPMDEWKMFKDETGEIVPEIVSEELWDKANAILSDRREKMSSDNPTSYQNKYAYSGKIICGEHGTRYQRSCYHYKSGDKEVWQCKHYYERGRKGCTNPLVYTTELDQIVREAFDMVLKNREYIIDDLVELYAHSQDVPKQKEKVKELEAKLEKISKQKSALIDLLTEGTITKEEYNAKKEQYNTKLQEAETQLEDIQQNEKKTEKLKQQMQSFREVIAKGLDFEDGMPAEIVDSLLDRIEVYKTDDPKIVKLKVYFRIFGDGEQEYTLSRKKGAVTSVCSIFFI